VVSSLPQGVALGWLISPLAGLKKPRSAASREIKDVGNSKPFRVGYERATLSSFVSFL
jgi:hypothetical protein